MLFKIDEVLLLENLTYMANLYPLSSIMNAKGKTIGKFLDEIDMEAIEDDFDYASYMPGIDWKNIIKAIRKNKKLLDTRVIETHLDSAYGGGGGISVVYICDENNEAVVAFRGTATNEWIDDFLGANQIDSLQQINALEWYKMVYNKYKLNQYTVTITGHSKGGNKAKYITILNDTVDRCISFDGQGFSDKFMDHYKKEILARQDVIDNNNIDFDYVNILMNDIGKRTYYLGYNYGRGGFAEAHCPNTFFDFDDDGNYEIRVNPNGQRNEMKALNKYINSMIRSAFDDKHRSGNNKLVGTLVEKAFSIGEDNSTASDYISFLCDMVADPEYLDNTSYLLSFTIQYSKENPEFLGAFKGIMTYFNANEVVKLLDAVDELVNSNKLNTILNVSNFLILHVNGIVVKKVQSIARKKYGFDLTREQVQRLLQIITKVKGMLGELNLSDGTGLIVNDTPVESQEFTLPTNLNITVLAGGLSSKRNMSLHAGFMVTEALREKGYNAILIDSFMGYGEKKLDNIDPFSEPDKYSVPIELITDDEVDLWAAKKRRTDQSNSFFGPNVIEICKQSDIVFIALNGESGENGKVQAAFDLLDINYTGSDYFSSAISSNKMIVKDILTENGISTPKGFLLRNTDEVIKPEDRGLKYPVIVKPNTTSNRKGITIAKDYNQYLMALVEAFKYSITAIVEEYLEGREFIVSTVDGKALPVLEVLPLCSKIERNTLTEIKAKRCPPDISDNLDTKLKSLAEKATALVGLSTYSVVSFIVINDEINCIECDSLPQLTPYSHISTEAKKAGIEFEDLCVKVIELGIMKTI